MKVPIKALGWATRFFWAIALAFAVTCAYSASLIRVNIGEPATSLTEESLTISLPVNFDNKGFYTITDFNFTTLIMDVREYCISKATTVQAEIPSKNQMTILHNISLNIFETLNNTNYLLNDSELTLWSSIRVTYANVIPFAFASNTSIPWGAPLSNLTIGAPQYEIYNTTHLKLTVPVYFENHSPYFGINGSLRIELLDNMDQRLEEIRLPLNVATNQQYDELIETVMRMEAVYRVRQLKFWFETSSFNYGPVVKSYG